MQKLKNLFVGFVVSFIGSIPLGYLNVVGYKIYATFGLQQTISYLFGVIFIEIIVIYCSLLFAKQLIANQKLIRFIEGVSIVFMFLLAIIFYVNASKETSNVLWNNYIGNSPLLTGLTLSCLNFIQIPFWTSWNLYLLNGNYIEISKSRKYFYVFGAFLGAFLGMLVLILSLDYLTLEVEFFKLFLFRFIIPFVFVCLGIQQCFTFSKKYFLRKN